MTRERVCVDFSGDKFKFARLKEVLNKKEITDLVVKDIKNLSDVDIAKVIRSSFNEVGTKVRNVICTISSHLVMSKNIEIPSRNPKEIQEIINLQSGRYTAYSREEIILDYIDIGVYRQNYAKILLVIAPQKIIKRYCGILGLAGLESEKISIAPEAISRIYYPHISKAKVEGVPISIIHFGDNSTDFIVSLRNRMIFLRNFPIGVKNFLDEKEKYKGKFIEEIKKSLESYQSEDIEKTPNQIILTGAIQVIEDVKPILDDTLHIPISMVSYLDNLPLKKDIPNIASASKQVSFLDVISPLFMPDEKSLNLVPQDVKLRKKFEERGKEIIKMGIMIMAAFVLICSILMGKISLKRAYLESLTSEYQSTNEEAQKLEQDFSRMQIIRGYLSKRGHSLEILNELHSVIPPDIYFNTIRFNDEQELSIKGTSESMSTVFALVSEMEKSKYFKNVKTKYTTKRKDKDRDLTDFQITCALEAVD